MNNTNENITDQGAELRRQYKRDYYAKNADKMREYHRKYRKEHREQIRQYNANYWNKKALQATEEPQGV